MFKAQIWGRAAMTGAMVAVCAAAACQSVLDIEEPKPLAEAGATGGGGRNISAGGAAAGDGSSPTPGDGGQSVAAAGGASSDAGAGGAEPGFVTPECEDNELRCGGATDKTPQICVDGRWIPNVDESAGDCELLCDAGRCVECVESEKRCSVCQEGDEACSQRVPQTCKDGAWENATQPCPHYCAEGVCQKPASCAAGTLATSNCNGESCCLSLYVGGGSFRRNYAEMSDFDNPSFEATLSPFLLDKFEVTVGRMQQFVAAFPFLELKEGDGKAANVAGDSGWTSQNVLPKDDVALKAALASCGAGSSWSDGGGPHQRLPVNCIDFDTAYAFCIWDGGRLPTDAEWNFAASGGDEHRIYPWPAPVSGPPIDETYAVYNSLGVLPLEVGGKPKGNGRWGQADLAGNVAEMVLDFANELSLEPCINCVDLNASSLKWLRGSSFAQDDRTLVVPYAQDWSPDGGNEYIGFRCARDVK